MASSNLPSFKNAIALLQLNLKSLFPTAWLPSESSFFWNNFLTLLYVSRDFYAILVHLTPGSVYDLICIVATFHWYSLYSILGRKHRPL